MFRTFSLKFLKIFLVYLFFERERCAQASIGEVERDGERESQAGTEPNVGLEPTNHEIMT